MNFLHAFVLKFTIYSHAMYMCMHITIIQMFLSTNCNTINNYMYTVSDTVASLSKRHLLLKDTICLPKR